MAHYIQSHFENSRNWCAWKWAVFYWNKNASKYINHSCLNVELTFEIFYFFSLFLNPFQFVDVCQRLLRDAIYSFVIAFFSLFLKKNKTWERNERERPDNQQIAYICFHCFWQPLPMIVRNEKYDAKEIGNHLINLNYLFMNANDVRILKAKITFILVNPFDSNLIEVWDK